MPCRCPTRRGPGTKSCGLASSTRWSPRASLWAAPQRTGRTGQTDTALTVGGRRFGTTARKVDGGYVLNGHKFFVSLARATFFTSTPALLVGEGPWLDPAPTCRCRRSAPGVTFKASRDPLGMRGTVSRYGAARGLCPGRGRDLAAGTFWRAV